MFLVENVVVVNLKYVIYQDIAYLYKRSGVFGDVHPPSLTTSLLPRQLAAVLKMIRGSRVLSAGNMSSDCLTPGTSFSLLGRH